MKRVKTIFASVVFAALLSVQAIAGNGSKVIAVINKADWCPTCEKHGERAMAAFMENNKDGAILFVANDVTNDETKKKLIYKRVFSGVQIPSAKSEKEVIAKKTEKISSPDVN